MIVEAYEDSEVLYDRDHEEYENGPSSANRYSATGNEADIEDNVLPPSTPTPVLLSEKLRRKPPGSLPKTPCRLASAREEFKKNIAQRPPSTAERLTCRPKSAIETITDAIKKPEGSVPPLALPTWHTLPLDNKIPGIRSPLGLLYYSPGKLSKQLHRRTKAYNLNDPYNRERVVGSPYTALHDPHAKEFVNRPETKRLLHKQGLINENNEVIYTLREFNKYRDYLRTLYTDDVHESVHGADELWKKEQDQLRKIHHYLHEIEEKEADQRRKLNMDIMKQNRLSMISRYLRKQRQTEARLLEFEKQKQRMNLEKILRNNEKSRMQREKLKIMLEERERAAIETLQYAVLRNRICFERKQQDDVMMKKAHENQLLEWMESKINQSKERVDRLNQINISCRENLRRNAAKRQHRIENYRRNIPILIEKRKALEARKREIARKYFYIWLDIVHKRRNSRSDTAHESCWIRGISGTLDETVKYLRFQTDTHERLDNFILNIIRLKEDIKRQLELEETEEEEKDKESDDQEDYGFPEQ